MPLVLLLISSWADALGVVVPMPTFCANADAVKKKMVDMNSSSLDSCISMVRGSAVSMGLEIVE